MRPLTRFVLLGVFLGAVAAGVVSYQQSWGNEGFFANSAQTWLRPPWSQTKVLAIASAAVMLPALLLGVLEWRADRAFRRELAALRASDVAGEVVEYEGPEGAGVLLLTPTSRTLLLRPFAGLGRPRVLDLGAPPPPEPPEGAPGVP